MTQNSFFQLAKRLDEVIAAGPAQWARDAGLRDLLSDNALTEYFVQKLNDPGWLAPLVRAGLFTIIPDAQRNEDEGTVSFPSWPVGEYLKRIAGSAPEEVLEIVRGLAKTDNARVHDVVADIAVAIPLEQCELMVPKLIEGIRCPFHLALPLKIGTLISRLSLGGRVRAAIQLAGATLEITPEPESQNRSEVGPPYSDLREPRARFGLWEYEQILSKNVPDLVRVAGRVALSLLCGLLDRTILLSDRRGDECRPHDFSHVWRGAIEEHGQNLNSGLKPLLVSAVRDAAEVLAKLGVESAISTIQELENRAGSWVVFRRIALHVIRVCSGSVPELAQRSLLDRGMFESPVLRHEYYLLEKDYFGRLSESDQAVILSWIEEGPSGLDVISKRWSEFTGKPWTSDEESRFVRQWKRDQLAPLEGFLTPEWKRKYAELVENEGKPGHPDFAVYHEGGAWGPSSPLGKKELSEFSVTEVVTYLNDWKPTGDQFRGASIEGLARELTVVLSADPEKYCSTLAEFKRLSEPTYVRAVIDGFQDALRQKRSFAWSPVLDLCVWAVGKGRDIAGRGVDGGLEMDPNWGWTRTSIVRLLNEGLSSSDNPIRYDLREKVWPGIRAGTDDPDPTADQEKKYWQISNETEQDPDTKKASSFDPFTSAINSVRGTALQAVVQYALWIRREMEKSKGKEALEAEGLESMPEVRQVLEEHLDNKVEPSIAVRTIYGERAPWLQLLDPRWLGGNRSRIFDRGKPLFWHAAWDTYICYCAPYDKMLESLKDEYLFAAQQIGKHAHKWKTPQPPDYSLAQHLISFYWRGKVELHDSIMTAFYDRADMKLRSHAMSFVGRSLRNTTDKVPDAVGVRIRALWDERLAAVKRGTESDAEELVHFGWWFSSGKFDDEWSITQLLEALRLAGAVEPDHLVIERLVGMKDERPAQSVEALKLMVERDKKGWGILGWREQAREILRAALESNDGAAQQLADDLVNFLGRRGHFDFGELLKT